MFGIVFPVTRAARLQIRGIGNSKEKPLDRLPICPHDWLEGDHQFASDNMGPTLLRAVCAMTLTQFFGWRSATVMSLRVQDITTVKCGLAI